MNSGRILWASFLLIDAGEHYRKVSRVSWSSCCRFTQLIRIRQPQQLLNPLAQKYAFHGFFDPLLARLPGLNRHHEFQTSDASTALLGIGNSISLEYNITDFTFELVIVFRLVPTFFEILTRGVAKVHFVVEVAEPNAFFSWPFPLDWCPCLLDRHLLCRRSRSSNQPMQEHYRGQRWQSILFFHTASALFLDGTKTTVTATHDEWWIFGFWIRDLYFLWQAGIRVIGVVNNLPVV